MKSYLDVLKTVAHHGIRSFNTRTQSHTQSVPFAAITYTPPNVNQPPIITTRKLNYKAAIGEVLAYLRGYTTLDQFHSLNVKTWDANANNPVWLANPNRKGEGDLGQIYGAIGNGWTNTQGDTVLSYRDIIKRLKEDPSDRGLIWSLWDPSKFDLGCLRPCMYSHQFSVLDGKLNLTSNQRSCDLPLGGAFNLFQVYFLLWLTAKLTGYHVGVMSWAITLPHIYVNQLPQVYEQLKREPKTSRTELICHKPIRDDEESLERVLSTLHPDDFTIHGYEYHPVIKFPFTV